jgi:hypothetical protein
MTLILLPIGVVVGLAFLMLIGAISDAIKSLYRRHWLKDDHDYWEVWRKLYNWPPYGK